MSGYSVGQVAEFAKVTVRTLHHYDEIGLLSPGGRTAAGYRRYDDADLDRLQQILFYRELGFPLDDIAKVLDDDGLGPVEHLSRQHRLLRDRIERLQGMAVAVERAIEARRTGMQLTPEEKFELFGPEYQEYEAEAEQRWGDTDAYRESARRAARLTKADWVRVKAEGDEVMRRIAEAVAAGLPADGEEAMAVAEEHRQQICRNFYECSYTMQRGLAEMFVADERFQATYENLQPGAAAWFRDAIIANADRAEG